MATKKNTLNKQTIGIFDSLLLKITGGWKIMEESIVLLGRYVGAGLAMIGAAGAGIGIGLSVQGALEGMARNPDTYGNLLTNMILGIAFSEAIAIYCLVIAFLMLFKVV
jgi:ATP synthase F0 subunit c